MKNILKIIVSDVKRLTTNVVAMVVIMGLTVIPCLYAWFNILSNWDPYGEESTGNLQVAVVSTDQGIMVGNYELNIGDIIISNLKENTTIGWIFPDTEQDAIEGVYAGDYYAALVIDEEFSSNMISFLSGEIENPVITYYENEKKNAIAPKITSKVKTTIEREVDQAFIHTIAESFLSASEYFATVDEDGNLTGQGITKLEQLDSDLNGVILLLNSYIAVMDSTESVSDASDAVTASAESITKLAEEMAKQAQAKVDNTVSSSQTNSSKLENRLEEVHTKFDTASSYLTIINKYISDTDVPTIETADAMNTVVSKMKAVWGESSDTESLNYFFSNISTGNTETDERIQSEAAEFNTRLSTLDTDVTALKAAEGKSDEDIAALKAKIVSDVTTCQTSIDDIRDEYSKLVPETVDSVVSSSATSVAEIEKLLNYNATSIDSVSDILDDYVSLMNQSKDSLIKSRDEAVEMEAQLASMIDEIKSVNENEKYQAFMELLRNDPEFLADFISSPVDLTEEYVYPIENNGSATAPFYIVLSIWVGALIMSTILKTTVKDTSELDNPKNWQLFIGRYFSTFVIGQIQTIITVLGAFLFVGIQCENYVLFWLACAWTSMVYSLLLYSFTYSFGNVGEALSVILMVIQVAGAGGTFPIEVLPKVFQMLYKFMPFNYSMNALRECVGGFYENTYKNCMITLIAYVGVALVIGIVLYHPSKLLNEKIEESKEKSGILI